MKDFYDLLLLSQLRDFNPKKHKDVIQGVFQHRGTIFPTNLSYDAEAKGTLNRKWKRFLGAIEEESQGKVPADFSEVVRNRSFHPVFDFNLRSREKNRFITPKLN